MPYATDRFSKARAQRGQRVATGGCLGPHRQQERSPTRLQGPRSPCMSSPSQLLHPPPRGLCSPHCSTAQVPSDFPAVFSSCLLEYLTQINRPSLDISPEQMHGLDLPPPLGLFLLGPLQTPLVLPERSSLDLRRGGGTVPGSPGTTPQALLPCITFTGVRDRVWLSFNTSAQCSGNTAKRTIFFFPKTKSWNQIVWGVASDLAAQVCSLEQWKLMRNADSWAPCQAQWTRILTLTRSPGNSHTRETLEALALWCC